ncbi:MAG: hypothetical protein ACTSYD_06935 [Candidatus Heimdallarchaeaceae archaeon]
MHFPEIPYKAILNSVPHEIVYVDCKHIIRYLNLRAFLKYGNLVGTSIFDCHGLKRKILFLPVVSK